MSQLWNTQHQSLDRAVLGFTAGEDHLLDQAVFFPYDLKASEAHAAMLARLHILSAKELKRIQQGLSKLHTLWREGKFHIPLEQEDGHTAIEAYLTKHYGAAGEKIHTGRSRNDQSLVMVRLYLIDQLKSIQTLTTQLQRVWSQWAKRHASVAMPGYTHMQRAMPTTVGVWQFSFVEGLKDVAALLKATHRMLDQSPLGSGAGYGVPLALDRAFTAKRLGFARVQKNPIYCQLSRCLFEPQALQVCSQITLLLGRWANDLLLFTMEEFGFFSLPKTFCTGSSIMPQKQNYDVLELLRARHATVVSAKLEVEQLTSRLYSGYQRDLQGLKAPLVRGIQTTLDCLQMAIHLTPHLTAHPDRLTAAMDDSLYATEKVYRHVQQGMPFRRAYGLVKKDF